MRHRTIARPGRWMLIAAVTAALAVAVAVSGCQTVKGVGQDIQNVAQHGEDFLNGR